MKTLFIPAKKKVKINPEKIASLSKHLPKNIAIAYSIQYSDLAFEIKKILLSKDHKITETIQILGCSKPKFSKSTQAVLLIGSGRFHAVGLAHETNLPIYILESNNLYKTSKGDIDKFKKKQKTAYLKYLNAEKIGILISTKPGQENLKKAITFKKKSKKNTYLFICNNINKEEFENFNIDSWINTACSRLDSSLLNLNKIKK